MIDRNKREYLIKTIDAQDTVRLHLIYAESASEAALICIRLIKTMYGTTVTEHSNLTFDIKGQVQ